MELFSKIVNGFDWVLNTPLCYSKLFLPYTPIAHRYFTQKSVTLHKTAGKGLFFTFPDFYGVLYLSIYLLVDSLLACFILNNKSISFLVKTGNTLGTAMYFVKRSGIHVWCMCEVFMCIYCIFNMCVWYMCGICVYIYIYLMCGLNYFYYFFIENTDFTYCKSITTQYYAYITWSIQIAWIIHPFNICFTAFSLFFRK